MSKRLDGIIACCKDKASSWHLNEFPDGRKHAAKLGRDSVSLSELKPDRMPIMWSHTDPESVDISTSSEYTA